ncbi:hypothetical protein AA958_26185 [Streptomyces sp. CNQ-509]|nr:hypothetical protein AA958_26185 [Streptomyces sp. CNQ-509]
MSASTGPGGPVIRAITSSAGRPSSPGRISTSHSRPAGSRATPSGLRSHSHLQISGSDAAETSHSTADSAPAPVITPVSRLPSHRSC